MTFVVQRIWAKTTPLGCLVHAELLLLVKVVLGYVHFKRSRIWSLSHHLKIGSVICAWALLGGIASIWQNFSVSCLFDLEETFHDWFVLSAHWRFTVLIFGATVLSLCSLVAHKETLLVQILVLRRAEILETHSVVIVLSFLSLPEAEFCLINS